MIDTNFMSNFFVLGDPVSKRHFRGKVMNDIGDFGEALRDEINISQLNIEYAEGTNEPGNFFWNRLLEPFCITDSLMNVLTENKITGWKTIPAVVKNKLQNPAVEKYSGISVTGRIDPIDYSKSAIVLKVYPGGPTPHFKL